MAVCQPWHACPSKQEAFLLYLGSDEMLQSQANMVSLFAALSAMSSRLTGRIFAMPARIHFAQLRLYVHDFKVSMKTHLGLRVWAWNHVSVNGGCVFATVARWWEIVPQTKPTSARESMQDPFQHRAMVRLKCVFLSTATGTIAWYGFNHYESAVAPPQTGHSCCLTCCMNGSWFFQIDAIKTMKNPAAR